jgi:hypothetical protein
MRYKVVAILVFNFIFIDLFAQFSIKVNDEMTIVSRQSLKFNIDVELLNETKYNYLLFGIEKSIDYNTRDYIRYCDSNNVAAFLFVLYDSSKNLIKAGISFEYREVTIDTLMDFFKAESDRFWLSRIHLKRGMQYKRTIDIDLKDYRLVGNDFYYTITYYQGRNIKNYIDLAEIEKEAKKHGSHFFMGCQVSNYGRIRIE